MSARRSVVIHGHFYQPPRENPWLDLVEREANAAPWHDWNERIERECYRAVVAARVPAADGHILDLVNTLEWISYNVGPTLLEWLEREAPSTYRAMLSADRVSAGRTGGYGNAIAMPFHHVILPLASRREKETEVRWGIADFRRRFGRDPLGMWLPETAVDEDSLDALATLGIGFTIVAPHQVKTPPPHGLPGRFRTASGRTITLCIYDGALSHDIAFGPLIRDADAWAAALIEPSLPATGPLLRSAATDGETFGHHHAFGEMALAATLHRLRGLQDVRVENFASFLARHPPTHDVELVAPTAWSCPHGVERWRSDCGCRLVAETSQAWRGPLRAGLEWLAAELHAIFATEGERYFPDPWSARDDYSVIGAPSDVPVRGRELLELERNTLRMFTSCGWFFDEVSGLETIQVLKYAARAIELTGADAWRLEAGLLERLDHAKSNDLALGSAADLFRKLVRPRYSGEERAAAGFIATLHLQPDRARPSVGAFLVGAMDDSVQTHHRRTGRIDRFTASVHRVGALGVEVDLQRVGSDARRTLTLNDLPEHESNLIRDALRREALRDVFGPEDLVRLAHGSVAYSEALAAAVVRLVPDRLGDVTPGLANRLGRALDLLALEQQPVPFDAQTRFHRFMKATDPEMRRPFELLGPRLGFAAEAFRNGTAP